MSNDKNLRNHVINLLQGGHAYATFDTIVKNFPFEMTGKKPKGFDHSAWQLLEHIRITQWDIVEFSISADHISPKWPEEYWPKENAPAGEKNWHNSVKAIKTDLKKMQDLVTNPKTDLFAKIPHGTGQTILREALLIVDHSAYHLGQIVMLRKILGIWPS
jgi:uncharacterized damage-inducible protein DinB